MFYGKKNIFGENVSIKTDILRHRYIEPPFSILDTRKGGWLKRKRKWLSLGIAPEKGRNDMVYKRVKKSFQKNPDFSGFLNSFPSGSSLFDPVLCELMYSWFCPVSGYILDPFAGESVKGIVAEILGYHYTGIELSEEQVKANYLQVEKLQIKPNWILGDSFKINELISKSMKYDFIFTSPPYYNLEIYSNSEKDGSSFDSYSDFMDWYGKVFGRCVFHLKENRFLVVKVGEIRNEKGDYRGFVSDNIRLFMDLGLSYYNELILVNPVGSWAVRVENCWKNNRKIGKVHQNVLVFFKGDLKEIRNIWEKKNENIDISK